MICRPRWVGGTRTATIIKFLMASKNSESLILERVVGLEPTSSAWKAEIISHYTIPAVLGNLLRYLNIIYKINFRVKN
jgi:hypothetical protein